MPPRPFHLVTRSLPTRPSLPQLCLRRLESNFQNRSAHRQPPFGRPPSPSSRRRRVLIPVGLGVVGLVFVALNLERVPVSGRLRFNCVPVKVEVGLGKEFYKKIIQEHEGQILPKTHPYSTMVNRVMERLVAGSDEKWEAVVIDDEKTVNAFVIPGGKVFVYSGLIPICGNDDALAAILGHEIAHNVAHHMGERMSVRWALATLTASITELFGIPGSLIKGLLHFGYEQPGSRRQESEADYIGLLIMAKACYNPEEAVAVRERMMVAPERGDELPQFLSTHPSDENRIKNHGEWLHIAKDLRAKSDCEGVMEHVDDFHRAFNMQIQAQQNDEPFW